jgi:hypothetical protein
MATCRFSYRIDDANPESEEKVWRSQLPNRSAKWNLGIEYLFFV